MNLTEYDVLLKKGGMCTVRAERLEAFTREDNGNRLSFYIGDREIARFPFDLVRGHRRHKA